MKIIKLAHDEFVPNPLEEFDGQWTHHSFSRKHTNYTDPETLLEMVDGEVRALEPELQQKLDSGLAFILSCYQHSGTLWSIQGSGPQCRWDTAQVAGLFVWEHAEEDMGAKTVEDRRKDAQLALDTYNAWCNGDTYYFEVEEELTSACGHKERRDIDDGSCGGFVGPDLEYMAEAVRDIVQGDEARFEGNAAWLAEKYDFVGKKA